MKLGRRGFRLPGITMRWRTLLDLSKPSKLGLGQTMRNAKMATLSCPLCGARWDMFRCEDFYELVPQIAPCESYQATSKSAVCKPVFEAGYQVFLETHGLKPAA
jgi:hypothetical protein